MSTAVQDPDLLRSASHRHMAGHLPPPFSPGAVEGVLAPTPAGRVVVEGPTREPLLMVSPASPLERRGLRVRATLLPGAGPPRTLPVLDFAPYTEAGATLALDPLPPRGAGPGSEAARTLDPFTVELAVSEVAEDGVETALPALQVGIRLRLHLLEGHMGRTLYLLGAEKQRVRRALREVAAMRHLEHAHGDALDRMGADLGVPRFADALEYDAAKKQVVTRVRTAGGVPVAEPDEEFRLRLRIFRPFLLPSRRWLLEMLNGPGSAASPNAGALGRMGVAGRFRVVEDDHPFAVAVHLVAGASDVHRLQYLQYVRDHHLLWPAAAGTPHDARFQPAARKKREGELRKRLRARFAWPAQAALAPFLAAALDRAARCMAALGDAAPWQILRAQDAAAGSRYELGLGVDAAPLAAARLDALALAAANPARPRTADAEAEAIVSSLRPAAASVDPEGSWLLEACGLRTVHRVNAGRLYLSHLPTFGMAITGTSAAGVNAAAQLEARYEAPGTPGSNAVLVAGLYGAAAAWAAAGLPAWTVLSDAAAPAAWGTTLAPAPGDPVRLAFAAAGLPSATAPATLAARLGAVPGELLDTLRLDAAQAARIRANAPGAAAELARLVELLRAQGLASVLPLATSTGHVLLVVGVVALPDAGLNLAERRATGFRWYAVPLSGPGGTVKPLGSRTTFTPGAAGVTALVALGYARRGGGTDPYEVRVELPQPGRLTLRQYEYLMNLLGHAFPAGVEVNTYSLRRGSVDLDGDGAADPLPPALSRTYRPFRRARNLGVIGVPLEPNP